MMQVNNLQKLVHWYTLQLQKEEDHNAEVRSRHQVVF